MILTTKLASADVIPFLKALCDALCLSALRLLPELFVPPKLLVVPVCTLLSQHNSFSYCTWPHRLRCSGCFVAISSLTDALLLLSLASSSAVTLLLRVQWLLFGPLSGTCFCYRVYTDTLLGGCFATVVVWFPGGCFAAVVAWFVGGCFAVNGISCAFFRWMFCPLGLVFV